MKERIKERIRVFKTLHNNCFQKRLQEIPNQLMCLQAPRSATKKKTLGRCMMCEEVKKHKLLQLQLLTNRGIVNIFTGQMATREQAFNMLNYRQIGMKFFQSYVKYHILKTSSSANTPVRCNRILTMSVAKSTRKRTNARDKKNKQVIQCLQRKLVRSKYNIHQTTLMNNFLYIHGLLQTKIFLTKAVRVTGQINCKVGIKMLNPLSFLIACFGHQM